MTGAVLLRRRSGQNLRPGRRRRALQGLPLRRHQHQRGERRSHARAGKTHSATFSISLHNITSLLMRSRLLLRRFPLILSFLLGQWEFQVGPSVGVSAGDETWVARYILEVSRCLVLFAMCRVASV
jgi:hypothetical protein